MASVTGKRTNRGLIALFTALVLAGCTNTTITPIADNTFELKASAAPICGAGGAADAAERDAAIATIRNGFDNFTIFDRRMRDNVHTIGITPGGAPIIGGTNDQSFMVRMYHINDPGAENAVSAKTMLGANWQNIVINGYPKTCW
jgi:hypothetical protein